jgi:G6PDH family F420-dependent oxidoreductase
MRIGTGVTAPILRMHPVVVAHAAATAAVMLPGRFFLGLGTGERLSEHVLGQRWPGATERRAMLEEAVDVIRQLFDGGNVNHRGEHFRVENARLFTRPVTPPPIVLAVSGPSSAELAGRVADGMIAVTPDPRALETFEASGGAGKPRIGQLHVCWAESERTAVDLVAQYWPNAAVEGQALVDLARPEDFEMVAARVPPDELARSVTLGPDPRTHVEAITRFAAAGFTEVYVHQIGPDQEGFLDFYRGQVLPEFH